MLQELVSLKYIWTFIVNDDTIVAEAELAHHQSPPTVSWSVRNTDNYTGVGRKVIKER